VIELVVIEPALGERLLEPLHYGVPVPVASPDGLGLRLAGGLQGPSSKVKMYLKTAY
jgi:hypothetical protein